MWNANSKIRKRQGNDLSEGRNGDGVPILVRGHGEVRTDFGYDNPARARAFPISRGRLPETMAVPISPITRFSLPTWMSFPGRSPPPLTSYANT